MASVGALRAILALRMLTLLTLAVSALLMGLNNRTTDFVNIKFTDLIAYRYVFAVGAVGFLYTLIQLPFAIYNVVHNKRLIRNGCLPEFDYFGDKVMALLLASGVGVGFGVTFEFKRAFEFSSEAKKYLDRGNISTGILLAGTVFMALLLAFSSSRRSPNKGLFK
ncbi:CASP-like protein 4D1 [Salvia miltiorrhiza]|uniref:CASP-like protein 4D1 n=1 Tax=Salvia miltiorrhiza TaxID=226208 RepID=UPI0025AC8A7C|nr:CASP-like protein 4D1 [Salvia miltiorrhiza]